jgi:hypothetical protein
LGQNNRDRRKQKKAAEARKKHGGADPGSLRARVVTASRWPVTGAWVVSGWRKHGSAGTVLLREHPFEPRNAAALIYVDLWCLGVKSASIGFDVDVDNLVPPGEGEFALSPCAPELVAAIVEAGSAYALGLGFGQPTNLPVVRELLRGLDPAAAGPIECGKDGQPLFMPGPSDDVGLILQHLEGSLGREAFGFAGPIRA